MADDVEKKHLIKNKAARITAIVLVSLFVFIALAALILQIGAWADHGSYFHPDYEKQDISSVIYKDELTDDDYELLYRQTGLTRLGIDGLIENGQYSVILDIQEDFFTDYGAECDAFAPFFCLERNANGVKIHTAVLENGDVLVSPTTHLSYIDFGHAALVVNGSSKLLLHAVGYGTKSCHVGIYEFSARPAFLILRPKADKETVSEIVDYAENNLINLDYSVSGGLLKAKYSENPTSTQCALLVWQAYKHAGIEIDSDGGGLVVPQDIANSSEFELVQVYGMDPDSLWK